MIDFGSLGCYRVQNLGLPYEVGPPVKAAEHPWGSL